MFGLSLGKILLTILIIVIVWKGFAFVSRLARDREKTLAQRAARRPTRRSNSSGAGVAAPISTRPRAAAVVSRRTERFALA
jgi:hypothetical protein